MGRLIARQRVDEQLELALRPRVLAQEVHELAEGHPTEAGVARVDVVRHGGQRLELHPEETEVLGHPRRGRGAVEPALLSVPAGGRVERPRVALDVVEAMEDLAAPLVEVVHRLEPVVVGHHGAAIALEALVQDARRRRRLVE